MSHPRLIILGGSCESTWNMQAIGLKSGAHSPFEWHFTTSLSDVIFILELAANNKPLPTCRVPGNTDDTIEGAQITTSHYINVNYAELMERRVARLLAQIQGKEPLVFYRHDWYNNITRAEADTFSKIIRQINPDCQFKMLVASDEPHLTDIDWLMHRQYDVGRFLEYFSELGLKKKIEPNADAEAEAKTTEGEIEKNDAVLVEPYECTDDFTDDQQEAGGHVRDASKEPYNSDVEETSVPLARDAGNTADTSGYYWVPQRRSRNPSRQQPTQGHRRGHYSSGRRWHMLIGTM